MLSSATIRNCNHFCSHSVTFLRLSHITTSANRHHLGQLRHNRLLPCCFLHRCLCRPTVLSCHPASRWTRQVYSTTHSFLLSIRRSQPCHHLCLDSKKISYDPPKHPILPSYLLSNRPRTLLTQSLTSSDSQRNDNTSLSMEDKYTRLSQSEHVLHRSSMYVGETGISKPTSTWVLQRDIAASRGSSNHPDKNAEASSSWTMVREEMSSYPALLKIFDEILVNASDNRIRHPGTCNQIDVVIHRGGDGGDDDAPSSSRPYISVANNGTSIPIQIHKKENIYIPELLFGNLLTGSNFNDDQKRLTGGRHGYGAKLTNLFSNEFRVEIHDGHSSIGELKRYQQKWENNMSTCHEPQIHVEKKKTNSKHGLDYTKITFYPDLARLTGDTNMVRLPEEAYILMRRRVVDIAGCSGGKLTVTLNGEKIEVNGFEDYLHLYRQPSSTTPIFYYKLNPRWEVAIGLSETKSFESISFVNGMNTSRGGSHVDVLANQVSHYIAQYINNKFSKDLDTTKVMPRMVERNLLIFANCLIENPSFDTQTKDYLTSKPETFGSSYELSKSFLRKLVIPAATSHNTDDTDEKSQHDINTVQSGGPGIIEEVLKTAIGEQKVNMARILNKISASSRQPKRQVLSIPKLEEANYAGGKKGIGCTLIVTEGDSAKALAVSGLEEVGRDYYGVFPLRGKLLNVRDVSTQKLEKNAEIKSLCAILGLQFSKSYETLDEREELRYGHVMLMTDQDTDGSHIKGLFMNFLRHFWPALLRPCISNGDGEKIDDRSFLSMFVTPLLKAAKKGKNEHKTFFSIAEYNEWREKLNDKEVLKWNIKYYKGLGTSTSAEAKEYFAAFLKHKRPFRWESEDEDGSRIDMAFQKNRADDRKHWILEKYDVKSTLSINKNDGNSVTFGDFIDNELIHFSNANNIRALPCVIDGLKPSQRKVLYACFKRNLKDEVKVAQLAGYCSEHTAYHHGEASLHSTIIGMAQDFVGSNNINLLTPSGQFGTRLMGGKDAASPRYIYTHLSPLTRLIFPDVDDMLLNYKEEDGQLIEPEYFCPILPLLLVNGSSGIGTGWSTFIPQHNPRNVLNYIRAMIDSSEDLPVINPWVKGFNGEITADRKHGFYITKGKVSKSSDSTVSITELPIGIWTNGYKSFLVDLMKKEKIHSFTEKHTTTKVSFDVKLQANDLSQLSDDDIYKFFKLQNRLSTRNMHAFSPDMKIAKYKTPQEIVEAFFPVRLNLYEDRKSVLESNFLYTATLTKNKARFIEKVSAGQIDLLRGRKSKEETAAILEDMKFSKLSDLDAIKMNNNLTKRRSAKVIAKISQGDDEIPNDTKNEYDYLLNMPLSSLTSDKIETLEKEATRTNENLERMKNTSARDLWKEDLDRLEPHLD